MHLVYAHTIGKQPSSQIITNLQLVLCWHGYVCILFIVSKQSTFNSSEIYQFRLPWTGDAENFFNSNVLQLSSSSSVSTGISWPVLGGLAFVWVVVYICVWRGVKSTGFVAYITVPLPVILLVIILGRTLFLDGIHFMYKRSNHSTRCI